MDFLKSLGESEAAQYSTTDGTPTKQLYDRVQAALFAKAYNDDRLLQMMADSEKVEIANTIKALNQAAPHFIRARAVSHKVTDGITRQVGDAVELSLDDQAVNALIQATNVLKRAKDSGMNLEEFLKQENVFGEIDDVDPIVAQMAIFIKENNRSSNRMGVAFQTMAEFVADELERRQNQSMFVDDPEISLVDVLKAANERLKKQFGDNVNTIGAGVKGGFLDIFTETKPQARAREAFLASGMSWDDLFSRQGAVRLLSVTKWIKDSAHGGYYSDAHDFYLSNSAKEASKDVIESCTFEIKLYDRDSNKYIVLETVYDDLKTDPKVIAQKIDDIINSYGGLSSDANITTLNEVIAGKRKWDDGSFSVAENEVERYVLDKIESNQLNPASNGSDYIQILGFFKDKDYYFLRTCSKSTVIK